MPLLPYKWFFNYLFASVRSELGKITHVQLLYKLFNTYQAHWPLGIGIIGTMYLVHAILNMNLLRFSSSSVQKYVSTIRF